MKHIIKQVILATAMIGMATVSTAASSKNLYPPEDWVFTVAFQRFPYEITCHEVNNRGKVVKKGSGGNVTYTVTGFKAADRLICTVPNGRKFTLNMKFMFGVGRTKRVMGGEYFEGEIKRLDLKVKYQRSGGQNTYKSHVTIRSIKGKERVIYAADDMLFAIFPELANQPKKRWKP
ncbi:hypothetical protein FAP39_08915 [Shimia litoralis]|uniref:Uncharacterized protein n=1 Tax=Shimia litoralis TaxID=420403 RepID=A0A4U7N8J9_9RHOB|nr:hypothetical protein [Shimia litoralis]TKZ20924.1 hypothetical protein FAP39_08915 [Shimia litoralis]